MKQLIYLIMLLLVVTSVSAIGLTYTPARMTLRANISSYFGDVVTGIIRVSNPNNLSVNVTLGFSDATYLKEMESGFILAKGESRTVPFVLYLAGPGDFTQMLAIQMRDTQGQSAAAMSQVIVIAGPKPALFPDVMIAITAKKGADVTKTVKIENPHANLTMHVIVTKDDALKHLSLAEPEFDISPREIKDITMTVAGGNSYKEGGNVYYNITTKYYSAVLQSRVDTKIGSQTSPVVAAVIVAIILAIGIVVYFVVNKK